MNRYLWIVCSVVAALVALPCQASAASITETKAAIGQGCVASGINSTAMGYYTTASGQYSTAMGSGTTASGWAATAMGYSTKASGDYSIAMGDSTIANGYHSTVIGTGNGSVNPLTNDIANSFMVGYMASGTDTIPELFVRDGQVGVNTKDPETAFHVKRTVAGIPVLANHSAAIVNLSEEATANVLMLKVHIDNPTISNNFISFRDSNNNVGAIQGNGSGGIRLTTSGADFAEYLPKADSNGTLTPGDIVGLFPGGVSKKTDGAQRIMVVSTAPAVVGNQPKEEHESRYVPVSFLGQAPVRVEGAVRSGDHIVPSGRGDGIGRAVPPADLTPAQYGNTVGRAIQSSSEKGIKCVTVLVGLPQNELWETTMAAKDARIARLEGRLAALETKTEVAGTPSLLPGAGIIMGSLGLVWMDRRRRRCRNQNPAAGGNP